MAINNARHIRKHYFALIFFIFIGFTHVLDAQQAGGYFIDPGSNELRFVQRLAWSGGENASRYEVVIERESNGSYQSHLRESTTAFFINVSLSPGTYRFRVIPYDIWDRPGEGSQWMTFIVRPALQPELYNLTQDFVYIDNDLTLIMDVNGNNLISGADIYLLDENGTRFSPREVDSRSESNIRLFFGNNELRSGGYELVVINPGGLEAGMSGLIIDFPAPGTARDGSGSGLASGSEGLESGSEPGQRRERLRLEDIPLKPFYINLGIGWTPLLPIRSGIFGMSLLAGSVNVSSVFSVLPGFYIGPEFSMSLYSYKDYFRSNINMMTLGGNILVQRRVPSAAFNFRLGASYALSPISSGVNLNAGMSYFAIITRYFYMETGVDYLHSVDYLADVSLGSFRPWLGIGFQF